MSRSFITECLVLKSTNYKETDKILTLFTKSSGKVNSIARGVRKITSRKAGNLDIFDYSKISLVELGDFYMVSQAEVISSFKLLKSDLNSQGTLYLIGETLDKLLPYREDYSTLFRKVIEGLEELSVSEDKDTLLVDILVTILSDMGYWAARFPRDINYIKKYIESLADNRLNSSKLIEKIDLL